MRQTLQNKGLTTVHGPRSSGVKKSVLYCGWADAKQKQKQKEWDGNGNGIEGLE